MCVVIIVIIMCIQYAVFVHRPSIARVHNRALTSIDIRTNMTRMLLKKIAKQLLFISRMPELCAILQLVSTPLNPGTTEEQFRCSHPLSEHSN